MEFVSAEEFLKQDKKIQKVFIDWWKPSVGDLATNKHGNLSVLKENRDIEAVKIYKGRLYAIPLFTEGQLREFIEDKTDSSMNLDINIWKFKNKNVTEIELEFNSFCKYTSAKEYGNTLQAYWKVALEIAKENVENE